MLSICNSFRLRKYTDSIMAVNGWRSPHWNRRIAIHSMAILLFHRRSLCVLFTFGFGSLRKRKFPSSYSSAVVPWKLFTKFGIFIVFFPLTARWIFQHTRVSTIEDWQPRPIVFTFLRTSSYRHHLLWVIITWSRVPSSIFRGRINKLNISSFFESFSLKI